RRSSSRQPAFCTKRVGELTRCGRPRHAQPCATAGNIDLACWLLWGNCPRVATSSPTELPGYVLEPLRRGPEFNLYRGRKHGNDVSVLVLTPAVEELAAAKVARLGHEYALAAELESEWAARPLALVDHDGRPMLVLEDPGGDPLDLALTRPLELTRF